MITERSHNNFIFFKLNQSFRALSREQQEHSKKEFVHLLSSAPDMKIFSYTTLGLKSYATMMLWIRGHEISRMQEYLATLMQSGLGTHLEITYTLFGIERQSVYVGKRTAQDQAINEETRLPFLVIYPFTKTEDWYFIPMEERRKLMGEHILVGREHPEIRQLLLYSYGIDDHEFIVSYEMERLEDFQTLIIDLRATTVRKYTQNDLPIFTCIYRPTEDILALL